MFNEEVKSMFIGDFIKMIIDFIGEKAYNNMINEIGIYNATNEGIDKFKNKVHNWIVENNYCIF